MNRVNPEHLKREWFEDQREYYMAFDHINAQIAAGNENKLFGLALYENSQKVNQTT